MGYPEIPLGPKIMLKQEKVKITASFGATCFGQDDTTESVFERADEYLYKAKRSGRNLVVTDLSTDV